MYQIDYQYIITTPHTPHYRYFFNGQEADNEVYGKGVSLTAEFWQYDTRLGRRWNVDPVLKEYESPYACFAGNPVWYVDPNGKDEWIPGVDKNGNATYTAEKGDNFKSFISQFEFADKKVAAAIFAKAGFSTEVGGVKAGSVIKGKDVLEVTKESQILKSKWCAIDNDHRITTVMFAIQYASFHKERNAKKNGDFSVDLYRFIPDFPVTDILRYQDDRNRIILPDGQSITIHFMEIHVDKLGNPPTVQHYPEGGGWGFKDSNGNTYVRYKYMSGANPNAGSRFTGILMSIPSEDQKKFDDRYN